MADALLIFCCWSLESGMPNTGMPWYIASIQSNNPPCDTNALTFLCLRISAIVGKKLYFKSVESTPPQLLYSFNEGTCLWQQTLSENIFRHLYCGIAKFPNKFLLHLCNGFDEGVSMRFFVFRNETD